MVAILPRSTAVPAPGRLAERGRGCERDPVLSIRARTSPRCPRSTSRGTLTQTLSANPCTGYRDEVHGGGHLGHAPLRVATPLTPVTSRRLFL